MPSTAAPMPHAAAKHTADDSVLEAPGVFDAAAADEAHDILDARDLAAESSPGFEMPPAESASAGRSESANESEALVEDGVERAAHSTADTAAGSQEIDALEPSNLVEEEEAEEESSDEALDVVDEASEESFPASDAPSHTATISP
jgi:hypothetical protein